MKKLITGLLLASSLVLTGCGEYKDSAKDHQKTLEKNSFNVSLYTEAEAKEKIEILDYEGHTFSDAILATKTNDKAEVTDVFLSFYLADSKKANDFLFNNGSANFVTMKNVVARYLGEDNAAVGIHNNCAYATSKVTQKTIFGF